MSTITNWNCSTIAVNWHFVILRLCYGSQYRNHSVRQVIQVFMVTNRVYEIIPIDRVWTLLLQRLWWGTEVSDLGRHHIQRARLRDALMFTRLLEARSPSSTEGRCAPNWQLKRGATSTGPAGVTGGRGDSAAPRGRERERAAAAAERARARDRRVHSRLALLYAVLLVLRDRAHHLRHVLAVLLRLGAPLALATTADVQELCALACGMFKKLVYEYTVFCTLYICTTRTA